MGISNIINNFKLSDNPIIILEQAEKYHEVCNFKDALIGYIWFFDNSIKLDASNNGAKLVRCLDGWHTLSKVYTPAYEKLVEKKDYLYSKLKHHPIKNDYIDFIKICNYLEDTDESIDLFKYFHINNYKFAEEVFNNTMEYLFEAKEFSICETYMDNINELYAEHLLLLDNLLFTDKEYYNNEFSNTYIKKFLQNIENILDSLKITQRTTEINNLISILKKDMQQRNIKIKIEN